MSERDQTVRGGDREPADPPPGWAARLLAAGRVARMATVDGEGRPSVVAICYVLDDDEAPGVLYTPIDAKPKSTRRLRRVRDLEASSHVSILVDRWDDEDWTRLRWVRARGRGVVLEPEDAAADAERRAALGALRAKYPQYASPEEGGDGVGAGRVPLADDAPVIRVALDELVGWRFAAEPGDEGGTEDGTEDPAEGDAPGGDR
ncbi:MAG TPA: TIGR03668 family PPOX class F420-dependent oxidoreductase [Thermoanaerobaculia bacterium]|nr:TIGR03668 family PPOX class F420-dependent oxidoreductase [Thermoanaerobaculia bacterium]